MADPTDPTEPASFDAEPPVEGFGPPPRTVAQALSRALEFPERAVVELLATINEAMVASLTRAGEFQALGFGRWALRAFRSREPMALKTCYGWDPIEVPHPSLVDFEPSASLLRQLDDGTLNTRAMFTCTPLLQTLIQRTGVPQAQAAQVMRLIFVTFTDLLLAEGFLTLPGFGTLLKVRRPTVLVVDPQTAQARPRIQRSVQFKAAGDLLAALPTSHRALQWDAQREPEINYAALLADDSEWFDPHLAGDESWPEGPAGGAPEASEGEDSAPEAQDDAPDPPPEEDPEGGGGASP